MEKLGKRTSCGTCQILYSLNVSFLVEVVSIDTYSKGETMGSDIVRTDLNPTLGPYSSLSQKKSATKNTYSQKFELKKNTVSDTIGVTACPIVQINPITNGVQHLYLHIATPNTDTIHNEMMIGTKSPINSTADSWSVFHSESIVHR